MSSRANAITVDSRASAYYRLAKEFNDLDPVEINPSLHKLKAVSQRYQSLELIAEGGVKRIFKVYDAQTQRHLALAMLREDAPEELCDPFIHEAWLTALLAHPNIITIHDIGVNASGWPYFTMDLKAGDSLRELLENLRNGKQERISRYPLEMLLQIFLKICDALSYAHMRGVRHLDLKPANIQIGEFGQVLVCDWGMGRVIGHEDDPRELDRQLLNPDLLSSDTLFGEMKGTPGNMAPEQISNDTGVDERTDIYGLGSILYSILTLERPLDGETNDILKRTKKGAIVPPAKRAAERNISPALNAIVMKAMAVSPSLRYPSVTDLQADIQRYLRGFATEAEHAGVGKLIKLFYNRNRLICNILALSMILLLVGGLWAFVRIDQARKHAEHMLVLYEAGRNELEKVNLQNADSVGLLSRRFIMSGRTARAKAILEAALESDPDNKDLMRSLGEYYFIRQEFNNALSWLDRGTNPGDVVNGLAHRFATIKSDEDRTLSVEEMKDLLKGLVGHDSLRRNVVIEDQRQRFDLNERAEIIETSLRLLNPEWTDGWFEYDRDLSRLRMGGSGLAQIPGEPPSELEGLNLRELDISGSELSGIGFLKRLAIERLDIHQTPIREIWPLKRAVYLRELVVDPGQIPPSQLNQLEGVRIITGMER